MTYRQLSRLIAEHLEPPPDGPDTGETARCLRTGVYSDKLVWECCFSSEGFEWQPRDMVHDPAMTGLLKSRLIELYGPHTAMERIAVELPGRSNASSDPECFAAATAFAFARAEGLIPDGAPALTYEAGNC